MEKLTMKNFKIANNSNKKVKECYAEYLEYCRAIGQRKGTLESKESKL